MTARQTKNPLVSVIIPVYNGAEFIGPAIESALTQTYRNLEILAVDDGSTDNSLAILQRYAAQDPRIRVLTQPNSGVAAARNHALAQSRGDFIAPLDADDLWLPSKIERQVRRIHTAGDDCGFVYAWWTWIDEHGAVLDRSPRWRIEGSRLDFLIRINVTGNASVPLFRKRCLVEAGGYNSSLAAQNSGGCEDWEVVLRVAARHRIAVVPAILLGYRRRPGSMSQACDTMKRSQVLVIDGIRKLRPDLKPSLFRRCDQQFAMYLAGLSFWSGNRRQAIRWGFRAGLRLSLLVSPFVLRMLLLPPARPKNPQIMRPGQEIDSTRIPGPLLPYDFIVSAIPLTFWAIASIPIGIAARIIQAVQLARLRREATPAILAAPTRKPRILATACWFFPIYSQTFVYREVLALVHAGFEVRFAYSGQTSRAELPDDLTALWPFRRRILYAKATSPRDLAHYQRLLPEKVAQIAAALCASSGITEEELFQHPHFLQAFSFARFAEAWKPDYLHTYFFYEGAVYGFVASALLDLPRGVSCYADHMVDDYELKSALLQTSTSNVIVATSARIKRELEEIAGHPLPAAIVKPNGVDSTRFVPSRRPPSGPGRVFRGVAVNRIHAKKGVTYLVEAVRLLRDRNIPFTLEICGEYDTHDLEGPAYFAQLQHFVATYKLDRQILFLGRQSAPQIRHHLCEKDIFVAPFVELPNGDKDGIPTALLEAMAGGCAIVATDAGSITEVIEDNVDGLLVPQCDSTALADAIARLIADDPLRTRLATAARARVQREFDVSVCETRFHDRVRAAIAAPDSRLITP